MTLNTNRAAGAILLIRLYVGAIFVLEGILKFVRADALGPGRFAKIGVPAPELLANFDGVLEIVCGLLLLAGLFTRLATLPMIADMLGAILLTKVPLLWGNAALYPKEGGIWDFLHEARLEFAMLCGCIYLFIVGAGIYSADARRNKVTEQVAA